MLLIALHVFRFCFFLCLFSLLKMQSKKCKKKHIVLVKTFSSSMSGQQKFETFNFCVSFSLFHTLLLSDFAWVMVGSVVVTVS